jgi:hypothetical protein
MTWGTLITPEWAFKKREGWEGAGYLDGPVWAPVYIEWDAHFDKTDKPLLISYRLET